MQDNQGRASLQLMQTGSQGSHMYKQGKMLRGWAGPCALVARMAFKVGNQTSRIFSPVVRHYGNGYVSIWYDGMEHNRPPQWSPLGTIKRGRQRFISTSCAKSSYQTCKQGPFSEAIFVQVTPQTPFGPKDMGPSEYLQQLAFLHFFDQSPNADQALEKRV